MGIFIQVEVDNNILSLNDAKQLTSLCPVEIFAITGKQFFVQENQEDECTLCELCLNAAPKGAIKICKIYSGEEMVSSGG